jgi:hypothetical protein
LSYLGVKTRRRKITVKIGSFAILQLHRRTGVDDVSGRWTRIPDLHFIFKLSTSVNGRKIGN